MTLNDAYKNRMRSWWAKRQHYENVGPETRDGWWLQPEEERANLLELPPVTLSTHPKSTSTLATTLPEFNQTATRQSPCKELSNETRLRAATYQDAATFSSNEHEDDRSSNGDSLESIDSQESNCCSLEEDVCSQATALATNVLPHDYLLEHLEFLRQKTQPREVELVWALDQPAVDQTDQTDG